MAKPIIHEQNIFQSVLDRAKTVDIMSDERNFRTYYYDKFGIGGVEEKKSLEILLKEKPINVEKLKQFSLRFAMPAMYRNYVWKLILGKELLH